MSTESAANNVRERTTSVPLLRIDGRTIITTGKWIKIAAVEDEELIEGETVADPELFVSRLRQSGLEADIFTFAQKVPDTTPKHKYHFEWDNAAVIPITNFKDWWEKRAQYDVRSAVKKARRLGVVVRLAEFTDAFVEGIVGIYNESPTRQGKPFWHYQKDFDTVKRENSTYLERSTCIGAYYDNELIGFIRMLNVRTVGTTLQVISKKKHFDKKPTNALIAKAVEICELKGLTHLVYGRYIYNDPNSSLTEFKRRNGFEQVLLPRYYVPLGRKGEMALKLGLHHQLADRVPEPVLAQLRKIRSLWHNRKLQSVREPS